MSSTHRRFSQILAACFVLAIFAVPQLVAQDHVVSPTDLQKATLAATQSRQQNVNTLVQTFSNPKIDKALKAAKMDPTEVKTAISSLSDADLAQLAARAQTAQNDFAGGTLSDRDLLLILVAVAALILIIVAVH